MSAQGASYYEGIAREVVELRNELAEVRTELEQEKARRVRLHISSAHDVARTALAHWRDSAADRLLSLSPVSPLTEFGLQIVIMTLDDEVTRLSQAEGDADLDVVMKSIAAECGITIVEEEDL